LLDAQTLMQSEKIWERDYVDFFLIKTTNLLTVQIGGDVDFL